MAWRGFTTIDGLRESYCSKLSVGPSGRVFLVHGHIDKMTILDGYGSRLVPNPGVEVKVKEGRSGEIWGFAPEGAVPDPAGLNESQKFVGLQRYSEQLGRWEIFEVPEIRKAAVDSPDLFLPLEKGVVAYLLPDRLMQFDESTRTSRELLHVSQTGLGKFSEVQHSVSGGIWIGGRHGLGLVQLQKEIRYSEFRLDSSLRARDVHGIQEETHGTIFVGVYGEPGPREIVLRFKEGRWEQIAEAPEDLAGWEAPDGGYWLMRGAPEHFSIIRFDGYRSRVEERIKSLSGTFREIALGKNGSFGLATNISATRYSPRPWRTPPQLAGIDSAVVAMAEDPNGSLYFISYDRLFVLQGDLLTEYPYPNGMHADLYQPSGTCFLGGGVLTVATSRIALLTFDTRRKIFRIVPHPDGQRVRALGPRKAGGVWVALYRPDSAAFRLAYFDNSGFHEFLDAGDRWEINHLRVILETGDGSVWMGGAGKNGLAVYRDGAYRTFAARDGYDAAGSYAMLDWPDGRLWFGDRDGIQSYDGHAWTRICAGLETVRWMTRTRDGSIWVASGSGVHRYYRDSWVSLGVSEGLPDSGFLYVFEDSKGRIWACGTRGVSLYHPEADTEPPETAIPVDGNLRQMPPTGRARIVFAGTDRWDVTPRERLLYSHRLDGAAWSPFSAETVALYSDLDSGWHFFEVRAMDRNWNIDPNPASFRFKVLLPWYREPGFLALAFGSVLITGILLALHLQRHVHLGQLVAERTRDLSSANLKLKQEMEERERTAREKEHLEDQYRQAQKMEAIGRLSGGVAHDFNNILTVIDGYGDIALHALAPDSPVRNYLQEIQKAGKRAADLTAQLLAFSRKQVMQAVVLDLNAVVHDTESILRRLIGEDITLVTDFQSCLGNVKADPLQLQQVLMNLAVNARDAMPGGGRIIIETANEDVGEECVRARQGMRPGKYVRLSMRDTGVGMDPSTQSRIFEPFFTTKDHGKGTGLGLSMVFGIVKQSEGYIWVDSKPGEGSNFSIFLPRVDEVLPVHPAVPSSPGICGGNETILLVEDQEEVRTLTSAILGGLGYRVLPAACGPEALSLSRRFEGAIHALVTDIVMPGMNGREVADKIRGERPGIKVLLTSGYSDDEGIRQTPSAEGTLFLQKPFSTAAIAARLRELLGVPFEAGTGEAGD